MSFKFIGQRRHTYCVIYTWWLRERERERERERGEQKKQKNFFSNLNSRRRQIEIKKYNKQQKQAVVCKIRYFFYLNI